MKLRAPLSVRLGLAVVLGIAALLTARPRAAPGGAGEVAPPRPTPVPLQFTDVTAAAGLRFRHVNGAAGRKHLPETMGSGCAFLDADGDGWLDLFLVNSRPLPGAPRQGRALPALYRNNRDGTFTDVTAGSGLDEERYGMGCAAGDYDNDGRTDLYVSAWLDSGRLYHNEGGGRFRAVRAGVEHAGRWGASCAWLDYNRDGRLDLFVTSYVRYDLGEAVPCLRGGVPIYCGPMAYPAEPCALYRNRGDGTFEDVSAAAGIAATAGKSLGAAVWDLDGDLWPEILVANDVTPTFLFRNRGDGTFREEGLESGLAFVENGTARAGMGIDVAETGADGRPGILISNFSREPNSFFRREPDGSFLDASYSSGLGAPSVPHLGFGLFFFDANRDGWRDALVVNGHIESDIERFERPITFAQPAQLYANREGAFEEVSAVASPALLRPRVARGATTVFPRSAEYLRGHTNRMLKGITSTSWRRCTGISGFAVGGGSCRVPSGRAASFGRSRPRFSDSPVFPAGSPVPSGPVPDGGASPSAGWPPSPAGFAQRAPRRVLPGRKKPAALPAGARSPAAAARLPRTGTRRAPRGGGPDSAGAGPGSRSDRTIRERDARLQYPRLERIMLEAAKVLRFCDGDPRRRSEGGPSPARGAARSNTFLGYYAAALSLRHEAGETVTSITFDVRLWRAAQSVALAVWPTEVATYRRGT